MGTSKRAFAMMFILYLFSRKGLVVIKVKLETWVDGQDIETSDHYQGLVMGTSARCNHMLPAKPMPPRSPSAYQHYTVS